MRKSQLLVPIEEQDMKPEPSAINEPPADAEVADPAPALASEDAGAGSGVSRDEIVVVEAAPTPEAMQVAAMEPVEQSEIGQLKRPNRLRSPA